MRCAPLILLALALAGCAEETRVISSTGPLLGLPDTDRGGKPIRGGMGPTGNPMETLSDGDLIKTTPTGERFIVCQSPRHVIIVMRQLLASSDESDHVLLYNQLISDDTKRRAIMEGNDPTRVLSYLLENKADILDLLAAMPMGELATDVQYDRIDDGSGKNRERLRLRSMLTRKLEFTELYVQREGTRSGGTYTFLWVK